MLYFVPAIFFCSFYLINLAVAVVALSYEREMRSLEQEVRLSLLTVDRHGLYRLVTKVPVDIIKLDSNVNIVPED